MSVLVKDPVCGMEVNPHRNEVVYLQIHYAFCSLQCMERFLADPHLYVGHPGHSAPKQQGMEVIKRRRLSLASPVPPDHVTALTEAVRAMMGVKSVTVSGDEIEITYDLLQATAEQIEAKLAEAGARIGEEWPERLRLAFIHYTEECEIGNLAEEGVSHSHGSHTH
jgi:YHS domain-containing protein/copper chaperone CopZ